MEYSAQNSYPFQYNIKTVFYWFGALHYKYNTVVKRSYFYNRNFYTVKPFYIDKSPSFLKILITDNVINGRRITLPQIWIVQYHLVFMALFWTHIPWMCRYYSHRVMQLVADPLVISYTVLLWWFAYEYNWDIGLGLWALLGFWLPLSNMYLIIHGLRISWISHIRS